MFVAFLLLMYHLTVEPGEEATEESDSDSDSSWKSISPITSEEEYWTDSDEEESS